MGAVAGFSHRRVSHAGKKPLAIEGGSTGGRHPRFPFFRARIREGYAISPT